MDLSQLLVIKKYFLRNTLTSSPAFLKWAFKHSKIELAFTSCATDVKLVEILFNRNPVKYWIMYCNY